MKVRLAVSEADMRMAQKLRYHVFHDEMGAGPAQANKLDEDGFDARARHLLVLEDGHVAPGEFPLADGNLVGTYRLIPQAHHQPDGGFYSAQEFDLAPLLARHGALRFLELGRSCVLKRARGSAVVELLWQGIWDYVRAQKIDVMIGCASFEGTDVSRHAPALAFLARHRPTPPQWQVWPWPEKRADVPFCPQAADDKALLYSLPPLIKGYLRLGCTFGEGCVIDAAFNTIDVLVVLPVSEINPRFFARFGAPRA